MTPDEVELTLSGALFGGDPRGFLEYLGLHGRPLPGNRWIVRPSNDRVFISHYNLADDTEFIDRFDHLAQMPLTDIHLDDPEMIAGLAEHDRQLEERLAAGSDIAALFHTIQTDIVRCATHQDLISVVQQACATLRTIPAQSNGELLFSGLSAHLAIATDLLIRRVRLPAIMFRFDQDPDALDTIANLGDEGNYFASSSNWFQDIIGTSHYFGPLLGCLAPGFWCLPTERPPATILISLGTGLAGYRHTPMEPSQLLPAEGRDEVVPIHQFTPASCRVSITWWTNRLNQLFGYLCDPTVFSNKHGVYDPYEHQHWLLTFGQIFGLTTALQTSARNHATQRVLMNTLLDTYSDRILGKDFTRLCTYEYAKETADRVRTRMPEVVAALLMPLADRAIDSLRRVQDGFFFREQRGDENVVIRIPGDPNGHHRDPSWAAAMLLKLYRNATHGFGSDRAPVKPKDLVAERLLTHHTGQIPDDLVYLPFLYLLDVLCSSSKIREVIAAHARDRS